MDLAIAEPKADVQATPSLVAALKQAIGADQVQTSEAERRFFSQDVYRAGALPLAVVQPQTVEDVQACAALCHAAGAPMIPRGGGLSYTDGYLFPEQGAVMFDLRALNRIVHISAEDMVVTVEAGCTWDALDKALEPLGLRTLYWGPVSGVQATVGGALSQNSVFWGAVRHGVAAANVLGMDVVLADGTLLGVGAHGGRADTPRFFRYHGPELTGLFTGDCGSLGLKVRATFPLVQRPPCKTTLSFAFKAPEPMLAATAEVGRRQLVSEAAMFDAGQQRARLSAPPMPFSRMFQAFLDVAKADGLIAALNMARHGRRFLEDVDYSLNMVLEAPTPAELKRHVHEVREIMAREGAWSVAPTLIQVLAARPFPPPGSTLSASRFFPVHGIIPHSLALKAYRGIQEIFARHATEAARLRVRPGIFSTAFGAGAVLLEPNCHWDAPFLDTHPRLFGVGPNDLPTHPANPDAEALVLTIGAELRALFLELGAGHLQLGRVYPFKASRNPETWSLLSQFKAMVDPKGLMNPGALGFGP
jgi:FAD/FMN-containing dehydrogenase